jgi:spore germination cell wall hydrolase CwlJ-like protein
MSLCRAGSRFAGRLLLISALAAALVGCSSSSQQRSQGFEYAGRGLYQTHYEQSSQLHSKRHVLRDRTITVNKTNARHRKNNYSTRITESHNALKMNAASFVRPDDKPNIVTTTPTAATKEIPRDEAAKAEIPPSSQPDDESVIKKAKATIAAKMRDPDSVEFEGMERAARKNALGKSIDTICGFVRDKNSGPKPFLYLIQKDEAYIGGYTIATSEYRNICSITTLPGN